MLNKMSAIEICGISYQKKLNILRCLLSGRSISRKEVAQACSLSEVTVGKVSSVLCEQGFLQSERLPVGSGRHTEFFTPSDILRALVLFVDEESLSATMLDLSGNTVFEMTRELSVAIPYEKEADDFCSDLSYQISYTRNNCFVRTAILFCDGTSQQTREIFVAIAQNYFYSDISLEYEIARAGSLCRLYPNRAFLIADIDEQLSISLVYGGKILPKSRNTIYIPSNDPGELIELISSLICPIFAAVLPERIIIDSHKIFVDRGFREALCESISHKTNFQAHEIPQIENDLNPSYAELEALEMLREQICIILAGERRYNDSLCQ